MSDKDLPPNILDLAEEVEKRRRKKSRGPPSAGETDDRPVIRLTGGSLPANVDAAEAAMLIYEADSRDKIYQYGGSLVRVRWDKIRVSGEGQEDALRYNVVTTPALVEMFTLAARWEKWSATSGDWQVVNCPKDVAETYAARGGRWRVPVLLGVVTAPTLRSDGSLITEPGYDVRTGLLYDPLGVDFGEINLSPTRDDALRGVAVLNDLLRDFPFRSEADRSVALSGVLTAVARQMMPTAPMHAFDAPVAGSGKSKLVDVAAVVATGHRAAVTATGRDRYGDAELEKRLAASVLGGDAVISLDNLEEPLGGEFLCQLLTQASVKIRPFGKLQNVTVPSTCTMFATGNNLVLVGDLTRRSLVGRLDPGVERPELEQFDFEPVARAAELRVPLLKAALDVLVAHLLVGPPASVDRLGSYEVWSYVVRDALVWLGCADPADVMERTREQDPRLERLREMVSAWWAAFADRRVKAGCVVDAAQAHDPAFTGEETRYHDPDLRRVVSAVATAKSGAGLSPDRLGWWLKRNLGRTITVDAVSYRFCSEASSHGADWWLTRVVDESPPLVGFETDREPGEDDDLPFFGDDRRD